MKKCYVKVPFNVKSDSYIYLDDDRAKELEEKGFIKTENSIEITEITLYANGKVIETSTEVKKIKNGK